MTFQALIALSLYVSPYSLSGDLNAPTTQVVMPASAQSAAVTAPAPIVEMLSSIERPKYRLRNVSSSEFVRKHDAALSINVSRGEVRGFDTTLQLTFNL